ncbi:hypothetical protein E1J38_010535 [Seonamhaeicola sediminis]|uniref:Uncharacterized protein n=1 Tax=Seonamhaeicola sediminis TaxID=2528206 RepID=A0A562YCW1_9FLAO|nr:hypothetical protein [Seonamhaeicola sediminis]TWO32249.1 hypothetical protein E1J38_010535 [Seonamhaeicola sediminis]
MEKYFVCIVLLWFVAAANAQKTPLSIKDVDSTTYALFLKQDWKPIITLGKQSIAEGVDFYYLKVRIGIAYFKENKMFSAIRFLEEAYALDPKNVVVQDYLYWAYRYSGLEMESRLFYSKMSKALKDEIKLDLPVVSSISFNVLAANNLDYDTQLKSNANGQTDHFRIIPEKYEMYSLGMSHPISKGLNLFHQFTLVPANSVKQTNIGSVLQNGTYKVMEYRYYGDVTIALGNRWYLDTYLNAIFGDYDNLNTATSDSKIKYNNMVFGGAITKASYLIINSINMSVSNLNGFNQFQMGYAMSVYPLGSTSVVPFGSLQYKSQDSESNMVFTAGLAVTLNKIALTGFGTVGNMNNFIANNGAIVYNQPATALNEFGGSFKYFGKHLVLKVSYSFMNMESNYYDGNFEIISKTFEFNQQNITAAITWVL